MRRLIPTAILAMVSGCAASASQPHAFDVFFESNKASLTADARGIVDRAASAAHSEEPSRIVVQGVATGSTPRDARLAAERADAVIQALMEARVDPSRIDKQTMLVAPSTQDVAERVAAHKVQIELLPSAMLAQPPSRRAPQWVDSASAEGSAGASP